MKRGRLAWLVCLPLAASGGIVAHALAYRLAAPPAGAHLHGSSLTAAHGSALHWRLGLAACLAMLALGLVRCVVHELGGHGSRRVTLWPFALLPPVGFVVQESLERVLLTWSLSPALFLEPPFLVGLLLQLPFALAAYVVARVLVNVSVTLARALASAPRPRLVAAEVRFGARATVLPARFAPLALGYGQRAPPGFL
ncbi:MAG: hypothetical protein M3377_01400 [Actinomycetota bacterium]|nr:hypothetical protein [Actinomycetota bacterium]